VEKKMIDICALCWLTDLPAADRSGKSDPFCRFELNDVEVYKSQIKKKTLNPKWGEYFECEVVRLMILGYRLLFVKFDASSLVIESRCQFYLQRFVSSLA
jgi:C2 domain